MITAFLLATAAAAGTNESSDKMYNVDGRFYTKLELRLDCDVLRRNGKRFQAQLEVRSTADEANEPSVDVSVEGDTGDPTLSGHHKGIMSYVLPISSAIQLDLPPNGTPYIRRYMALLERFDFNKNKSYYFMSVGGTKEDLASDEADGFCTIEDLQGDLAKDPRK